MIHLKELQHLQKILMDEYLAYRAGVINEKEYCLRAKLLDEAIDKLELQSLSFHLQDTPVLQVASSPHSLMLEH